MFSNAVPSLEASALIYATTYGFKVQDWMRCNDTL